MTLRIKNYIVIFKDTLEGGDTGMGFTLKKFDDLIRSNEKLAELLGRKAEVEVQQKKHANVLLIVLAVIGGIAAVAGIAYLVYRFLIPDGYDDFDDFDDDFEDDSIVSDAQ